MERARTRTWDEAPPRRTHVALLTLFGALVATLTATAVAIGTGLGL